MTPRAKALAFERRWLKPAGIAAFVGVLLLIASIAGTRVGLKFPKTDADQLLLFHQHSSRLVAAALIGAVGFVLLAVPLVVLFQAAAGRSERVRRSFIPFVIIAPLLFGVQGALLATGLKSAAGKFVQQAPAVEAKARQDAANAAGAQAHPAARGKSKGAVTGAAKNTPTANSSGQTTKSASTGTGTTTAAARPQTPDQAAASARDKLATDLSKKERAIKTANYLGLVVALTLLFAVIYTALWAMRTGLLTRISAGLGMGGVLVLFFVPFFGPIPLMIWFFGLGMLFTGLRRAPTPPAWAAGEAIPWPPTARQQAMMDRAGGGGTIAGTGREVEPEGGDPRDGGLDGGGSDGEAGEHLELEPGSAPEEDGLSAGQRPKKRKRRR